MTDLSQMSDDDLAAIAGGRPSPKAPDLSSMSDDDLQKLANPQQAKSSSDAQMPIGENDSALSRLVKGTMNQVTPYLADKNPDISTVGKVADIVESGASGLAQGAAGALTAPVDIGTHAIPYMHNAAEYLGTKAANAITGKSEEPEYVSAPPAITPSVMGALNNDSQTAAGERVKLASMIAGPSVAENIPSLAKKGYENIVSMLPEKAAQYEPMSVMRGVSNSFNQAIDKANTFYDFPKQLAEGKSVSAPQLKNHLDSVISDVTTDPWHEAKSQVGTLQRIRDALPESGDVDVNNLLDLRKLTNKYFNPDRMTDKSATYGKLNSVVDSALGQARQTIPNFGRALDIADDYWRNGVAQPFLKNKVLNNVGWKPSDAHNLRMVDEGMVDPDLIDETKQKAINIINKTNDVNSYNAIRRTLPDDVGHSFDAAVLRSMPSNRLQAAIKAVYSAVKLQPSTAVRNIADVISPSRTVEQQGVVNAVKSQNTYIPLSDKNDVAQAAFENLVKAHANGHGQPLALPPPSASSVEPSFTVDRQGNAVQTAGDANFVNKGQSMGSTPDVLNAQRKNIQPKYNIRSPDDQPIVGEDRLLDIANGRKMGGRVNTAPSEAQKKAGNYKKGHMQIYGLDISIENPRGSERKGVDKDGKSWAVKMPDHYGYIKGYIGADKDHMDVYVGKNLGIPKAFVIDQLHADTGKFDEHKIFIGYKDKSSVLDTYHKAFSDGRAGDRIGDVHELSIKELKKWLVSGNAKKPMKKVA